MTRRRKRPRGGRGKGRESAEEWYWPDYTVTLCTVCMYKYVTPNPVSMCKYTVPTQNVEKKETASKLPGFTDTADHFPSPSALPAGVLPPATASATRLLVSAPRGRRGGREEESTAERFSGFRFLPPWLVAGGCTLSSPGPVSTILLAWTRIPASPACPSHLWDGNGSCQFQVLWVSPAL